MRWITLCLILTGAPVLAKDIIYWQTYHIPPISIKKGDNEGQGFQDKMLALITKQLPDYEHVHPLTTHVRALKDMREGKPVCHPGLFKTPEREQFMVFSQASMITPSLRLIYTEKADTPYTMGSRVNIGQLLNQNAIDIGLIKGRSYGVELDSQLNNSPAERLLWFSIEGAEAILKMVSTGRLDMTVAYPFEIGYYNRKNQTAPLNMATIDGVNDYAVGYVACSKTPWGEQVVAQIDAILPSLRRTPEYINAMTYWWQSERESESFKLVLNNTFLQ